MLCLFLVALKAYPQNQPTLFSIKGEVRDTQGNPLAAIISVHELNKTVLANLDGQFLVSDIKPGHYHLHITHMGFQSTAKSIVLEDGDAFIDLVLKESITQLQSLTVEANPFKNGPLEQSQTIDVIDRAFLEKNNGGTFANSLEKLPGISTINTGVGISKPVLRGMSFNRIMVNDRGIKQEGQQWGADHGLEIDPFDVDRVEVIKGPASLIYGSDGMAGVINIAAAPLPKNNSINASLMSVYRTNNNMLSNSALVEGNENDLVFKGRFTMQDFSDYRVPAEEFTYAGFVLPVYNNRLKNTAGQERHFSLMGGVRKNWGYSTVTVSQFNQVAGIFAGAVGVPRAYNLRHDGSHSNIELPRQENSHLKVIWNNNIQVGKDWLEFDLGYQKNNRNELSFPHTQSVGENEFENLALGLSLDVLTANARYNKKLNDKNQSIIGFQFQHMQNNQTGFEFLLPNFTSVQGGFFYFQEYRHTDNFILNAGFRLDGAQHDILEHLQPIYRRLRPTGEFEQRNPDINRSFFNYSASTGFSWITNEYINLKFNLGTAFRIPTPIELSTNGIHHGNFRHEMGNPDLDSERSFQGDLNFTYAKNKFLFSISPFYSYYQGYIYLAPSGRFSQLPGSSMIWEYRQNNAIFTGGEIKTQYSPIRRLSLSLAGEYVYNLNLDTQLPLPLTPPASALFGIAYDIPKIGSHLRNLYVFFETRVTATQDRVDRNERITEGYTLLEAGLGWQLNLGRQPLMLQVSGQNLTNAFYFNHLSRYRLLNLPEQGRNISFSLKIPIAVRKPQN